MLIDVHAHYDDRRYDEDREETLGRVKESVDIVINSGSNISSSKRSVELANKYNFIYASVGVHPHDTEKTPENTIEILDDLLKNPKVVAVGEIGFDYYHNFSDREAQKYWFKKQMDFAADVKYPVVVHDRDAHGDCLEMVKRYKDKVRGIFHCYAGSAEMSKELIKLGYMFSFGGVVTFANARSCHEVVRSIPIEYIMLETDCPYLAPHPHRGKRNDSGYINLVAQKIAELKNMPADEVIRKTGENAKNFFSLEV